MVCLIFCEQIQWITRSTKWVRLAKCTWSCIVMFFLLCRFFYIKFIYKYVNVHGLKVCSNSGNEKLGAKKEPDPDPTPYLFLTYEMKRRFSWLNIVFFILHSITMWSKVFPLKAELNGTKQRLDLLGGGWRGSHKITKNAIFSWLLIWGIGPPPLMAPFLSIIYPISLFCKWTLHIWKEFYTGSQSKI